MMYETGTSLEPEEYVTEGIIWVENSVLIIETDGPIHLDFIVSQQNLLMKKLILWQVGYVVHTVLSGSFPSKV